MVVERPVECVSCFRVLKRFEKVLAESCKELLPHTGIYWTEAQQAWKAVYRGEYVPGSHSSFKRFETHAAAIINAVGAATAHHEDEVRLA